MTKKEVLWREILFQSRQNRKIQFTQKELALKFGFSISTVFNALKTPRDSGAIKVTGRFFILEDYKKLLYLWASERSLKKDIYYKEFLNEKTNKLEGIMSPEAVFGLYSGFKSIYQQIPAEYDHLYVYIENEKLPLVLDRISPVGQSKVSPNFFIIEPDKWFRTYPQPLLEQIFVDIWNSQEWYSKDFLKTLEEKINLMI